MAPSSARSPAAPDASPQTHSQTSPRTPRPQSPPAVDRLTGGVPIERADVQHIIRDVVDYIRAQITPERDDRLWPGHVELYRTNSMNLAYGASGVALALDRIGEPLSEDALGWMRNRELSTEAHAPSLFYGLAGIAYAGALRGDDRADEAMRLVYESPLQFAEANVATGAAGWGLASLLLHRTTGGAVHYDQAVAAADHILATAEPAEAGTVRWRYHVDDRDHYGFGFGASGIALFLLRIAEATGNDVYLDVARRGLDHDLYHRYDETGEHMTFLRYEDDRLTMPYLIHGSSGVGAVLIRFADALNDDGYHRFAERIAAESANLKWSTATGQFEGQAGVVEFLLDMYRHTGRPVYQARAIDLVETMTWYQVEKPDGIAFPCLWKHRLSTDFATGSSGIAACLERVLTGRNRLFFDRAPNRCRPSATPCWPARERTLDADPARV